MRYFIVTYYRKPNGKYTEQVKVDTKIKERDLVSASVIIDYKDRKIIKSRFQNELGDENGRDFNTINDFYKKHYTDIIAHLEAKYQIIEEFIAGAKEQMEATDDMEPTE